ncbi:TonB-dependent receptor [Trichormus variabilis ARAD]|nr:TonB-dependent receptor [Trichormus variabilis ARAD]MBC1254379.1 TonB-dependent receptor [Trichormus variabilis V5]MBC1269491.1 TonB-dependent receptor [Trichormus variabilis FSR]MBC1304415.1 TonB-dependent receptor [Trichormus variabilis N2B]MBC1312899.1 TonB-dependent receptor [Trichormus variabilis PNB]MBC1328717.1 TonB-dependent receptor [Trichormus variabilis 9RC]MBD2378744.1 TonB-dependent receptor [Trichormus variabilis FACHB-319]QFZ15155.1 TonB-dependent receptor [Anabaena sp. YBS
MDCVTSHNPVATFRCEVKMKPGKILFLLLLTGSVWSLINHPANSQEAPSPTPLNTQSPVPNAQELTQVTGVRVVPTAQGLEVILDSTAAEKLQVSTQNQGNSLIADITNAQLNLSGENTFSQNNPVTGVTTVTVVNQNDNTIRVTVTGEKSLPKFELFDSDTGLILAFTATEVAQDSPAEADEPIELVVTATRTETPIQNVPRSITVIDREQIAAQASTSRNLIEILGKTVPGLAPPAQGASNFGLTLRGRNPQVLIDGVPQSTTRNASRDLRTIDSAAIERIEVVRGPSAIYGDGATGGVINIITRRPTEEKLTSRTEVGVSAALGNLSGDSFSTNLQHFISAKQDNFDFTFNFAVAKTGGFFDAQGDRIPSDPNAQGGFSDASSINLFGKFGVDIDTNQRLQLTFNRFDEKQDTDIASDPSVNTIPGRQKARALEGLSLDERPGNENTFINLQYTHDDLFNSKLQAQLYYRDYLTRFFPFDGRSFASLGNEIFQSRVESEKYGGRLQIETPLFNQGAAKLLWGVDYSHEDTSQPVSVFDQTAFVASGGLAFRKTGDRSWTPPLELRSLGLFAQLNWEISDRFVFNGGVRYENADVSVNDFRTLANPNVTIGGGDLNFNATLFNLGAVYALNPQLSVFANYAQGFSLSDIGLALRNAPPGFSVESLNPEPQKVDNYEIGIRGQWDTIQASLSAFYNESDLGTTFTAPGTVIRAPERIYGLEAAIDAQPSSTWQVGGTFTLIGGEIDSNNDGDYESLDGFRIPPLKLTAYVENETLPGWRNRLQALYSGNREVFGNNNTAFGRRPVESYFTVDYISSIKLGAGTLQLGLENLFNSQYFPVASQLQANDSAYAAARGRTLSIKYSFDW